MPMDLEDVGSNGSSLRSPVSRSDSRSAHAVHPSQKVKRKHESPEEIEKLFALDTLDELRQNESLSGQSSVYIKTWGCSHNWSDSEYMGGLLKREGYFVTMNEELADHCAVWILNSCTVKGRAQNLFESELKKARRKRKSTIICGCVPQSQPKNDLWHEQVSSLGVQQIDQISYVVSETLKGNVVSILETKFRSKSESQAMKEAALKHNGGAHLDLDESVMSEGSENVMSVGDLKRLSSKLGRGLKLKHGGPSLRMPKLRRSGLEEIVPINTGCLNQCTYCATKHARGDLGSYTVDEIVERIQQVIEEEGVQIVNLESEDTGAYGLDIGTNISELLEAIQERVLDNPRYNENVMLRLGISNPPYFLEHAPRVSEILKHPKVFEYMHIPVQSGSNRVLSEMARKYTIEEFEHLCQLMKERVPRIHLSTDIIVGFPNETDEDWECTLDLCRRWKFPSMYISPFFPRPNTPAARMAYSYGCNGDSVPSSQLSHEMTVNIARIKKERTKELTTWFQSLRPYSSLIGQRHLFICTQPIAKDGLHFVGLNKQAHKVCVKSPLFDDRFAEFRDALPKQSNTLLTGKILRVVIESAGQKYLNARIDDAMIPLIVQYPEVHNYILFEERQMNLHQKSGQKQWTWLLLFLIVPLMTVLVSYYVSQFM